MQSNRLVSSLLPHSPTIPYVHTHMCTHTHMYTHTHAHTCMYTHMHTHAHAHTCMYTHMHTHAHAHTCAYTCTHTHTHAVFEMLAQCQMIWMLLSMSVGWTLGSSTAHPIRDKRQLGTITAVAVLHVSQVGGFVCVCVSIGTCRAVWVPGQDLATLHLMHNCRKSILFLHCTQELMNHHGEKERLTSVPILC